MKVLIFHVDSFEYTPVKKEGRVADSQASPGSIRDGLVVMVTAEEADNERLLPRVSQSIVEACKNLSARRILLYPYSHLSEKLAEPTTASRLIDRLAETLQKEIPDVDKAPFGWNKRFNLTIKGHPLAEQFKIFTAEDAEQKAQPASILKQYLIMERNGSTFKPEEFDYARIDPGFKTLVETEAAGVQLKGGPEPDYIKRMRMFGIDWESMSDKGHMRYGPEGTLMFELAADYSHQVVRTLGFPVYHVRGTSLFNLNEKAIQEHAELFGQRMYQVRVGNESFVMRYSACFQQFAMIKDWQLSYRHLPLGAFEVADSYRLEQSGELLLGFRVRKLNMPDLHVFCKDLAQAREIALRIHQKIYEEIKSLGRQYFSLYNITSKEFFEENKDFFKALAELERKPVLLAFYPEGANYYWVLNIEYHIIDKIGRPREIGTVQIDVGNAERFDIKYVEKDGSEKRPVIIHTAILGSIERYLYALFDSALQSQRPMLPVWITPIQVRVIPVSGEYLAKAEELVSKLNESSVRCDLDDRQESVGRKIRDAETHWVPYIVMIGKREIETAKVSVRVRSTGEIRVMSVNELFEVIRGEITGKPFRPSPLPHRLSMRPVYG